MLTFWQEKVLMVMKFLLKVDKGFSSATEADEQPEAKTTHSTTKQTHVRRELA